MIRYPRNAGAPMGQIRLAARRAARRHGRRAALADEAGYLSRYGDFASSHVYRYSPPGAAAVSFSGR